MFTGIIESTGIVTALTPKEGNLNISIQCPFFEELTIDQSVAHNGTCLTVIDLKEGIYTVTAIEETLKKTNLGQLSIGDWVNLERCVKVSERLDGHIVQGHVDQTGILKNVEDQNGSYLLTFQYQGNENITVEKGSVCVNGISLTVVDSKENEFSVAIIPYTWENTNLNRLKIGDSVNLEFDIIGKYVKRLYLGK